MRDVDNHLVLHRSAGRFPPLPNCRLLCLAHSIIQTAALLRPHTRTHSNARDGQPHPLLLAYLGTSRAPTDRGFVSLCNPTSWMPLVVVAHPVALCWRTWWRASRTPLRRPLSTPRYRAKVCRGGAGGSLAPGVATPSIARLAGRLGAPWTADSSETRQLRQLHSAPWCSHSREARCHLRTTQ